jgi:hypothetical protein
MLEHYMRRNYVKITYFLLFKHQLRKLFTHTNKVFCCIIGWTVIMTGYVWTVHGLNPGEGKIFRPGTPPLQFNHKVYGVITRG